MKNPFLNASSSPSNLTEITKVNHKYTEGECVSLASLGNYKHQNKNLPVLISQNTELKRHLACGGLVMLHTSMPSTCCSEVQNLLHCLFLYICMCILTETVCVILVSQCRNTGTLFRLLRQNQDSLKVKKKHGAAAPLSECFRVRKTKGCTYTITFNNGHI